MSAELVVIIIREVLVLLPTLIEAGKNVAKLVEAIEKVWSEGHIAADDPRFAELETGIALARAKLLARAAALRAE